MSSYGAVSEKQPLLEHDQLAHDQHRSDASRSHELRRNGGRELKRKNVLISFFIIAFLAFSWLSIYDADLDFDPSEADADFDWNRAPSLPELQYTPCYTVMQCARLELPLDYFNATSNATISLAVIKIPAQVPVTHPSYGGPLLINPGGPGGSGVAFALRAGQKLQAIIDGHKFHDIISFDPRGVGLTEPAVSCSGSPTISASWALRLVEEGLLASSDAALGRLWSMSQAIGHKCADVGDDDIQHYMSTASVARDMLELVEAHGRWRHAEAYKLLIAESPHGRLTSDNAHAWKTLEKLEHVPGTEKIQYWGFSYGSYLGTVFATMFPDRIERVILDGVVDAEDYTAGLWYDNLVDSEKAMDAFYDNCARVGHPACSLATPEATPADIKKRVQDIVSHLYHNPLAISDPIVDVISWSDVRTLIFSILYKPLDSFPFLSDALLGIEQRDPTTFLALLKERHTVSCPRQSASIGAVSDDWFEPHQKTAKVIGLLDPFAGAAIRCTDGDLQQYVDKPAFVKHMESLTELSPTIGDIWASIRLECIGYPLRPAYRYVGPFAASNTSYPILWLSNTGDPVTPLASAQKMSTGFPGSVLLVTDGPGHCSIAAYSECTVGYVKAYMNDGTLPPLDTICQPSVYPFGPSHNEVMSEEVNVMSNMHAEIGDAMFAAGGGLMRSKVLGRLSSDALERM